MKSKLINSFFFFAIALATLCSTLPESKNEVQAQSAATGVTAQVSCPASGTSIQVFGTNARRFALSVNNNSGSDIRIGFLDSPSVANLTTTNSFILGTGGKYTDSAPGNYTGRVVCMSTTAGALAVDTIETSR